MLKLTEIKRRSTTETEISPILLSPLVIAKVEEGTDSQHEPCVKILSDEVPTMTCEGSVDALHEQIRAMEAKENGDADAVVGLLALVEALTARVEDLEKKMLATMFS